MSDDNFDWPSHNLENAQLEENLDKIKRQVAEDYKKMTETALRAAVRENLKRKIEIYTPAKNFEKELANSSIAAKEELFSLTLVFCDQSHKNELHQVIAKHLANGEQIPRLCIKWFAKNVLDPRRIQKGRGRPNQNYLHHEVVEQIIFFQSYMDYSISEAQQLISESYGISESHMRDIWANRKQSEAYLRKEIGKAMVIEKLSGK